MTNFVKCGGRADFAEQQGHPGDRLPCRGRGGRRDRGRRCPAAGRTVWEQSRFIASRRQAPPFVLNEPRGGVFRHVNLLVPPKNPARPDGLHHHGAGGHAADVGLQLHLRGHRAARCRDHSHDRAGDAAGAGGARRPGRGDGAVPRRQGAVDHAPQRAGLRRAPRRAAGGRGAWHHHRRYRLRRRQLRDGGCPVAGLCRHARRGAATSR